MIRSPSSCTSVLLAVLLLLGLVPSHASAEPDIAGVWRATTPAGEFRVLSAPNRDAGEGYRFLMLELGPTEEEFGFELGELLATLAPSNESCWLAEERFHLPLWAGGGYYMGETSYCLEEDTLRFHTDDPAAVFDEYPLHRVTGSIGAAGLWQLVDSDHFLVVLLAPKPEGGWEAIVVDADRELLYEELDLNQILFQGDDPPDLDGVPAQALPWTSENEEGSAWIPMCALLEDSDTLRFGMDQGPEAGARWMKFERIY